MAEFCISDQIVGFQDKSVDFWYPSNPTSPLSPPNPNAKITLSIQSTPMEKMRH